MVSQMFSKSRSFLMDSYSLTKRVFFIFAIVVMQGCSVADDEVNQVSDQPSVKPSVQARHLKINEGFVNPIGFYDEKPNFSWQLDEVSTLQTKYQLVVASSAGLLPDKADLWTSEILDGSKATFIDYEGKPLRSRQKVYWQVRYWDQSGAPSQWSDIAQFELGLLSNQDWQAKWIEIDTNKPVELNQYETPIHVPQHLRKEFNSRDKQIQSARLYITARGVFEAFLNGSRVGDDVLTPGYTPYKKRIETLTYDVTSMLQSGQNAFGIQLAEGWYAGRFGPKRHWHKKLELTPKVAAQLEIYYVDGSLQTIITDDAWQATQNGPIRTSGLYDGERYDANYELKNVSGNWHEVGYDAQSWQGVKTTKLASDVLLQPKRHFTTKNKEILPSVSVNKVGGKYIFDIGQNMVGVPRIKIPMKKGETLNLRFGEGINADGSLYTKNLGSAKQLDFYTAKQDGLVEWQPQFTFHGFRYVEISGFDSAFEPDSTWVSGVVQYTDFNLAGSFLSSNAELNQLQSNIEWGLKGNFLDIPTDCPQRSERLGWTGDALAFAPTSLFIADSHAFWAAWMKSIREEQFENHGVPVVVPNEVGEIVQAGWSDAAVTIPWDVYWRTGDKQILTDNYEMMTRWIKYHQSQLKDGISHMWTVGDWLQPYSTRPDSRRGETDHNLISTAFYARSLDLVARSARVLGKMDDWRTYQALFIEAKQNFQRHFFNTQGRLIVGDQTQTSYLLAIGFDLLDESTTKKAVPHLLEQFDAAAGHLRTGFLGTPLIAPVLDKIGRTDLVFDLIFKQSYPSWLYSVNQGATTMWERWDGFTFEKGYAKKAGSLNHYAYGAIGQWLYERMAGITPASAGYKSILITPVITEYLSFAEASFDSPHGSIESKWHRSNEGLTLNVVIPPNTSAVIDVPKAYIKAERGNSKKGFVSLGDQLYVNGQLMNKDTTLDGVSLKTTTDSVARLSVKTGNYRIEVINKN